MKPKKQWNQINERPRKDMTRSRQNPPPPPARRNVESKSIPSYITADVDKSLEERVEHLGMLAGDAEARGAREEAAARHQDRIEAATAAASELEGSLP